MREVVVFKGIRGSLLLVFNETAAFDTILAQLKNKLDAATDFFAKGTIVNVPLGERKLTEDERNQLTELLAQYGLTWQEYVPDTVGQQASLGHEGQEQQEEDILIINKTVRNGQQIIYDGSIIVIGDVNPGAQIIAGGDITIMGTCRGLAHAGANGNTEATITADKLLANQLRIAGLIARAPDYLDEPEYVETARIKDGTVVIEPANR